MISYTSSVLPIIAACFVQAKLEKLLNRVIPKMLRGILSRCWICSFLFR